MTPENIQPINKLEDRAGAVLTPAEAAVKKQAIDVASMFEAADTELDPTKKAALLKVANLEDARLTQMKADLQTEREAAAKLLDEKYAVGGTRDEGEIHLDRVEARERNSEQRLSSL